MRGVDRTTAYRLTAVLPRWLIRRSISNPPSRTTYMLAAHGVQVWSRSWSSSDAADIHGLRALGARRDVELDPLVLVQVAAGDGGREMGEHILASVVRGDEPEAVRRAEPLHGADSHLCSL